MKEILIAVVVLFVVGLGLSVLLAYFSKVFYVEEDPRIDEIEAILPGANCGACGAAGCRDFAKRCAAGGEIASCPPGGDEVTKKVSEIMGVDAVSAEPQVALVKCAGTESRATSRGVLLGVNSCAEALLLGGTKECRYGCMGYGDCTAVCNYGAITIYQGGVAIIDPDLCVGCTLCVAACPTKVISMVPKKQKAHVLCNSQDPTPVTKASCTVGCVGCKLCTRKDRGFVVENNLAVFTGEGVDPELPYCCPNDAIVDLGAYSALEFVESNRARQDYTTEKTEFKARERESRLKAAAERKAAAEKAAAEKRAAAAKGVAEPEGKEA